MTVVGIKFQNWRFRNECKLFTQEKMRKQIKQNKKKKPLKLMYVRSALNLSRGKIF
jgi:hypothetical protein